MPTKKKAGVHRRTRSRKRPAPAAGVKPAAATAVAGQGPGRLPRAHKGKRPSFHDDPAIDRLLAVITALTAEVSAACDRIATLERLLEQRGVLGPAAVETYDPDEAELVRRREAQDALIQRVFQVLLDAGPTDPNEIAARVEGRTD
jgi:hypothetical protein